MTAVTQTYYTGQNVVVAQPMTTTTVVMQQPMMANTWGSGMCDCFQDIKSCCCIAFLPSCFFASMSQRMGDNCCVGFCGYPNGCVPGGHLAMRAHLRGRHNIQGSICDDCCAVTCCLMCTMCQLSREMDRLNYPPGCC